MDEIAMINGRDRQGRIAACLFPHPPSHKRSVAAPIGANWNTDAVTVLLRCGEYRKLLGKMIGYHHRARPASAAQAERPLFGDCIAAHAANERHHLPGTIQIQ